MKLQNAKGTRDFSPQDKILRENVVDTLKSIFKLYGYNPIETPILERFEILSAKYAGGDEILKETFSLVDQGKRKLGLRYDLTVPFARYVGMNPTMKLPFKRYQIGRVFRDGPIKLGRYREFWQCDVDVVGSKTMMAEAELLAIAERFFSEIGLGVTIRVNNRKLLDALIDYAAISKNKDDVILSLDKLEKIGRANVKKELASKGVTEKSTEKMLDFFDSMDNEDNLSRLEYIKKTLGANEGTAEIESLLELTEKLELKNVRLDISLARGLSYYTGTVYEVFLDSEKFTSAIAAGGRYDNMVSEFLNSKQEYPCVGISFGLEGIIDILKMDPKEQKKSVVDFFIVPIGTPKDSLKIAQELRSKDLNVDLDIIGRGISKNLDFANKFNIPFVLFIGENELQEDKIKLKNMKTGKEQFLKRNGLAKELKKLQE